MEEIDHSKIQEQFLLAVISDDLSFIKNVHLNAINSFENHILIDAAGIILSQNKIEMKLYLQQNSKFAYLFENFKPEFFQHYNDITKIIL